MLQEITNYKAKKDEIKFSYETLSSFLFDKNIKTSLGREFLIAMYAIYPNNDLRIKLLPRNPDKNHLFEYKFCFNDLGSWYDIHVTNKIPVKVINNKIRLLCHHNLNQPIDLLPVYFEKAAAK